MKKKILNKRRKKKNNTEWVEWTCPDCGRSISPLLSQCVCGARSDPAAFNNIDYLIKFVLEGYAKLCPDVDELGFSVDDDIEILVKIKRKDKETNELES